MAGEVIDMHPVSRITIDAIGPAGQRVFLLQANQGTSTITLKIEKEQAQILAHSIDQLLGELAERFPRGLADMEALPEEAVGLVQQAVAERRERFAAIGV